MAMNWNEQSVLSVTEHDDDDAPPSSNKPQSNTTKLAPPRWYADHVYLAKPTFMVSIIVGLFLIECIPILIYISQMDGGFTDCGSTSDDMFYALCAVDLIFVVVFAGVLVYKFRSISQMRDGMNFIDCVFFDIDCVFVYVCE